ncbi:3-hydroxybutyryl-CoA dehydrogenase [Biomphalaria glabrata]|uniref:3-hydroxybutyryl-CoA dehydrogenase-like isoform X1 n=1 Tax=Biomphalaria glabrata TaxID=6526 RepID=A0A9U8EEP6_BIOGL|nr:3-hydroxybutyryl-CoA dehydrogenase-like isoform X1 [Biomphalaria glabrata]KAI8740760.1 3-hydroxybutyryl-CoA dehydrogenase-like [Biomphalaria glabrata]
MVHIAIIGAGLMGVKIAGEFAYHGHRVKIYDNSVQTLNKVYSILEDDKKQLYIDGLLPQKHFLGQVFCMSHLEESVKDADFIFEVVYEDLEVKQDIFERVSHCCKPTAVIASNTLQLDINKINERALNKQRTLGLRFLFPVYYIPEVEIYPANQTEVQVIEKVRKLVERMGKTLFFRSGQQPLILTEQQRDERKKARQEEILNFSGLGAFSDRSIPALHHSGNDNVQKIQNEVFSIIPSDLDRDCAICMDRLRDCLFSPCHHMVTCLQCGQMLQDRHDACPICRMDIREIVRVYHT